MSGRLGVCSIVPRENEQIDAVIQIKRENRSVIYGTVIDENGRAVEDAVVKLLQICGGKPVPLTHTFTDQLGQFLLGPLCPNQKYMLKVYKDNIRIRYEEIQASCFEGRCIGVNHRRRNRCEEEEEDCGC